MENLIGFVDYNKEVIKDTLKNLKSKKHGFCFNRQQLSEINECIKVVYILVDGIYYLNMEGGMTKK